MSALYNKHGNTIEKPNEGFAVPVVDNLTSDATNHALSAKQGKTLKGLIDANTDDIEVLNSNLTVYQKTLASGSTTVTYTNDSIDSNACFDFYAEKGHEDLLPSDWTVSGNTLTVTYDAQSENIVVGVQITKGVVVNG